MQALEKEAILELRQIEKDNAFKQQDVLRREKEVLVEKLEQLQADIQVSAYRLLVKLLTITSRMLSGRRNTNRLPQK
jgi:hypothetical protein